MKTSIEKDPRDGWIAKTRIELDAPRVLIIETRKNRKGLGTDAAVYTVDGGFLCHRYGLLSKDPKESDFREVVIPAQGRCTEKSVRAQHAVALARIEDIKAQALAHYQSPERCDVAA